MPVVPAPYDALLLVSFGGPEKPEDVLPFLENVTRGRGIPRDRLAEVGAQSHLLGGRRPVPPAPPRRPCPAAGGSRGPASRRSASTTPSSADAARSTTRTASSSRP